MMDDSASLEDSSMTVVQADSSSTIAFAYIKEVQSRKKRFFVLKSQPRRSSVTSECEPPAKSSLNLPPKFFLYAYKNKKYCERNEPKRVYDLTDVILLSRSTKKANQTILGVCLQEEALYLEFDTEDELSRWYFHLNEIFSAQRNCLWPELKQCVNVTLKNKELAAAAAKHGKKNLPGQYRFCLTDSAVLLVKDDLLNPVLSLPFPCIRSCTHSTVSNLLKIDLGRLSPLGEGLLHFKAEQGTPFKEMVEHLVRCLHETANRDLEIVKSRKNRRNSRQSGSAVYSYGAEDYQSQRPASLHCYNQRSVCAHCGTRASGSSSVCSGPMQPSNSNSGLGSVGMSDGSGSASGGGGSRGFSLPPPDCLSHCSSNQQQQQQPEDYCLMDLSTGSNEAAHGGGFHNRSPNSSMSLSIASEATGGGGAGDSERVLSAAASAAGHRGPVALDECAARLDRVSTWRYCDTQHHLHHHQQQQQQQQQQQHHHGSPVIRANSIGCRPHSRSQYPVPHHCYQQKQKSPHLQAGSRFHQQQQQYKNSSSQQMFTEHSFSRPRTTSDAASHHACCQGYAASASRGFRPRARSYGNKFGRSTLLDGDGLTVYDIGYSSGASPAPSLALSSCMRPLSESTASSSGELAPTSMQQQQQAQHPHRLAADDEGSYVTMLLRPTRSCLRQNSADHTGDNPAGQCDKEEEIEDQFDPYWTPPGPLDTLVDPRSSNRSAVVQSGVADDDDAVHNVAVSQTGEDEQQLQIHSSTGVDFEHKDDEDYFMMDFSGASN